MYTMRDTSGLAAKRTAAPTGPIFRKIIAWAVRKRNPLHFSGLTGRDAIPELRARPKIWRWVGRHLLHMNQVEQISTNLGLTQLFTAAAVVGRDLAAVQQLVIGT
jgi:hypothetical protein